MKLQYFCFMFDKPSNDGLFFSFYIKNSVRLELSNLTLLILWIHNFIQQSADYLFAFLSASRIL